MSDITALAKTLRLAAESEIAHRAESDTSDLWQDEASPENILALVEALEKARRANASQDDHINQQQDRIDQLEKGHQEAAKQINSWRRLAKQNIDEREKDISELEAARQRIAELEARQVDLEHISYIQVEEGTFYLDESMVKSAICAAGIRINGED